MCIPTKVFTEPSSDNAVKVDAVKVLKQKSLRKETRKVKAHAVRVLKDCIKRLIMEADTTCEACFALKIKYSVAKSFQDFTNLYKE